NDVVEPEKAAIVGQMIRGDGPRQVEALNAIAKLKPTLDETPILVRKVSDSVMAQRDSGSQGSLFGDDAADTTVMEEVKLIASTVKALRSDRSLASNIANRSDRIASIGESRVDVDAAAAMRD